MRKVYRVCVRDRAYPLLSPSGSTAHPFRLHNRFELTLVPQDP